MTSCSDAVACAKDADILQVSARLGARLKRVSSSEWAGPCPKCGGRDRFSLNTRKAVWNCRGCGVGGDAIELARHIAGFSFAEALAFVGVERADTAPRRTTEARWQALPAEPAEHSFDPEKVAQARTLWSEGIDPRGTIVERYLNGRRLKIDDDLASKVIRFHRSVGWRESDAGPLLRVPAMIAAMRRIDTNKIVAVSLRRLTPDGTKVGKPKFRGAAAGAAVMLDTFDAVTHGLCIGEGVETALSGRQLGLRPTWAVGSKGAISSFPVLGGVTALTILTEPDAEREANVCATRWDAAGREVFFNRAIGGKDLNDALRGLQ